MIASLLHKRLQGGLPMLKRCTSMVLVALLVLGTGALAQTPDITGKWTASFETGIGTQDYTYDFVVKNAVLTGKAKSNIGEAVIKDGKVDGTKVTFVEMLNFDGQELKIDYTGTIVSPDEIKFTRQVADIAKEELVAKRAK
jgi:hypothetical protein